MYDPSLEYSAAIKYNERSSLYKEKSKHKMYFKWRGIKKNHKFIFKNGGVCVYMYKILEKICKKQVILADFGEGTWVTRQKWNEWGFSLYIFGTFELWTL